LAQINQPLSVHPGAKFHFEAGGQIISALPGFYAMLGSTVSIKSNMACTPMRPPGTLNEDIDSTIVKYYYDEASGELPKEETHNLEPFSKLSIFPNPSNGNFKLESLGYASDQYSFELVDVNGKILYSQSAFYFESGLEKTFSFNELPTGVYLLKILNEYSKVRDYKKLIILK